MWARAAWARVITSYEYRLEVIPALDLINFPYTEIFHVKILFFEISFKLNSNLMRLNVIPGKVLGFALNLVKPVLRYRHIKGGSKMRS